jgi:hypothetical protein
MRFLVTLFFIFLALECSGQSSFYKLYSGKGFDRGEDVIELEDSSFIISGSSSSWDENQSAFLLHVDRLGNYLWSNNFGGTEIDGSKRVLYKKNDGFFLLGHSNSFSSQGEFDLYLVKTDLDGNLQWQKTINYPGWQRVNDAIWGFDSTILVVGESLPNIGESNMFFARFNQNGDTLCTKEFGSVGSDKAVSLIQSEEDSLYMIGGEFFLSDSSFVKGVVLKINSFGNIIWQDTINEISGESGVTELVSTPSFYGVLGYSKDTKMDFDPFFGRFNWDGSFLSGFVEKDSTTSKIPEEAVYVPEGNRIAMAIPQYVFAHPIRTYDMLFANFGADGLYWINEAGLIEYEQMESIGQVINTMDNSTVFIGSSECQWVCETSKNGGSHIYMMKVRNHNQFPPTDQYTVINNLIQLAETDQYEEQDFNLYPNPLSDFVNIISPHFATCNILNIDGKILDSFSIDGGVNQKNLTYLNPGIYWIVFETGGKRVVKKIICV